MAGCARVMLLLTVLVPAFAIPVQDEPFRGPGTPEQPYPSGYFEGCLTVAKEMPFCDASLPIPARVKDLISRLTLDEKMGLLGPDVKRKPLIDACSFMDSGVPRLGIPRYTHLVEDNSGAGGTCIAKHKCPTNFPGPTGLAASFNRTLWRTKGAITATEQRAFNNLGTTRLFGAPVGLTGFGPNVNLARDPRFGRVSELPGEDPVLSGAYAAEMVRGMQRGEDARYIKVAAALKHFDAYSVEDGRGYRFYNILLFDLFDSYLPQFATGFRVDNRGGGALATMCSYVGVNGAPMCANAYLLQNVLRHHWGRPDVHVQSDCGAIGQMMTDAIRFAKNGSDAAAKAMNAGCDLDDGDLFFSPKGAGGNGGLLEAISRGAVQEARVDEAVARVLTNERFRTGLADPLDGQVYATIGAEAVNSTAHQQANLDAAQQSIVLLRNDGDILPFAPDTSLAVVGPHAISKRDLLAGYAVDQLCFGAETTCWPSIGEAFAALHPGAVSVVGGVGMNVSNETDARPGIANALAAAQAADVVVLCLGIGGEEEYEGHDRPHTRLPGLQEAFARAILALGKPTILVLVNGGIVSFDNLLLGDTISPSRGNGARRADEGAGSAETREDERDGGEGQDGARDGIIFSPAGIVEAFYPSVRGGEALYMLLSGKTNRWGKLPVTIYPAAYTEEVDMHDFEMAKAPGRTYRYYTGKALFPFGFGLSYTRFKTTCTQSCSVLPVTVTCRVANVGGREGDAVLQVYHRPSTKGAPPPRHPVPIKALVDFARISLPAGSEDLVEFVLPLGAAAVTTRTGAKVAVKGEHVFEISDGTGDEPAATINAIVVATTVVDRPPRPS